VTGYFPELNLFVGNSPLVGVDMRVWGWEYEKRRIDPTGPTEPPYKIVEYPGEKDWIRQIDIRLWYGDAQHSACQEVSVSTSSEREGAVPSISRDVVAPAYAETGYEGHNQRALRTTTDHQVLEFVALARDLLAQRVVTPARSGLE
jgi:hypothetical protein